MKQLYLERVLKGDTQKFQVPYFDELEKVISILRIGEYNSYSFVGIRYRKGGIRYRGSFLGIRYRKAKVSFTELLAKRTLPEFVAINQILYFLSKFNKNIKVSHSVRWLESLSSEKKTELI